MFMASRPDRRAWYVKGKPRHHPPNAVFLWLCPPNQMLSQHVATASIEKRFELYGARFVGQSLFLCMFSEPLRSQTYVTDCQLPAAGGDVDAAALTDRAGNVVLRQDGLEPFGGF